MLHIIKYSLKAFIRNKSQMFWVLMFPIILGILFKTAFSGLSDVDAFTSIPVAVITQTDEKSGIPNNSEENQTDDTLGNAVLSQQDNLKDSFKEICKNAKMNDMPLLLPDFDMTEEDALKKLEDNDIYGIIYLDDKLSLKVSANTGDDNTRQSILDSFVSQYNASASIIEEVAKKNPEKIGNVLKVTDTPVTYNREYKYSSNNAENYTQYFYNLLAMACLFTALAGMGITIGNQGNLSDIGIRKNITPVHKLKLNVCELLSGLVFNYILNIIAFAFIIVVLKIDMTFHLPQALLAVFVSTLSSMAFGFFIGSFPTKKRGIKEALGIGIIMFSCFLSGLMIGSMRIIIEEACPVINKVNPAALISDSLYSLANYDDLGRYYQDITTLLVLAVIFTIGGFLLTRRKKYASI